MLLASLAFFAVAVVLGGLLLMPRLHASRAVRRGALALGHGALGAVGLAFLYGGLMRSPHENPVGWVAAVLISVGLSAGAFIYLATRRGRRAPVLVIALHIIMAGMGTMIAIGFVLS